MSLELLLKTFNNILVQLEGPGEDIGFDGRIRSKHGVCNCYDSWILAAETRKGHCWGVSRVELEVNQTNWEHKHISLVQNLCEEAVSILVRRHKANMECPLHDDYDFGATRVKVRWDLAIWCEVNANQRYSQEWSWNFVHPQE